MALASPDGNLFELSDALAGFLLLCYKLAELAPFLGGGKGTKGLHQESPKIVLSPRPLSHPLQVTHKPRMGTFGQK